MLPNRTQVGVVQGPAYPASSCLPIDQGKGYMGILSAGETQHSNQNPNQASILKGSQQNRGVG